MDHATSAGAGALIINGLSLHAELNINTLGVIAGVIWIAIQAYYKIKNERKKNRNGS